MHPAGPIHVMLVDDSAVVRGLVTRILESDPDISVVASAPDGQRALDALGRYSVDVVVLDVEMPVMDGLTALPKLLAVARGLPIIMASTLTHQGADTTIKALAAGAADWIAKPSARLQDAAEFRRDLIAKIRTLGGMRRAARLPADIATRPAVRLDVPKRAAPARSIRLRPAALDRPQVIALGSSTGGPQALYTVIRSLAPGLALPIILTQHMPAAFTATFAEHLSRQSGLPVAEARDRETILAGRVYLAPGGFHLLIEKGPDRRARIRLSQEPPENFCRPAVDPMLRTAASAYDGRVLAAILTGMGHDGMRGAETLVAAGGTVLAQDEETSVVWGMPGAVATAGLCSAVLPIQELGAALRRLAGMR